jgi:hypothetical protein
MTHSNLCEANKANVEIASEGACKEKEAEIVFVQPSNNAGKRKELALAEQKEMGDKFAATAFNDFANKLTDMAQAGQIEMGDELAATAFKEAAEKLKDLALTKLKEMGDKLAATTSKDFADKLEDLAQKEIEEKLAETTFKDFVNKLKDLAQAGQKEMAENLKELALAKQKEIADKLIATTVKNATDNKLVKDQFNDATNIMKDLFAQGKDEITDKLNEQAKEQEIKDKSVLTVTTVFKDIANKMKGELAKQALPAKQQETAENDKTVETGKKD